MSKLHFRGKFFNLFSGREAPMTDRAQGIDISVWQDNNSTAQMVDFNKAKSAGASFAFIKASQGLYLDSDFVMNWQNAGNSGILRSVYHYLDFKNKPANKTANQWAIDQAVFYWGVVKNLKLDLGPVCDYESAGSLPASTVRQAFKNFLESFYSLSGMRCIIYTGSGFWSGYGSNDQYWLQYPVWWAQYYYQTVPANPTLKPPFTQWLFWQYSDKGDGKKYGCESTNVDLNYFNGTVADLYAYANQPLPNPVDPQKAARLDELNRLQKYVDQRRVEVGPLTDPTDVVKGSRINELDRIQLYGTVRKAEVNAS
jgi:lysozyme